MDIPLSESVILEQADEVEISPRSRRLRRGAGPASAGSDALLDESLAAAGFETVADADLRPAPTRTRRRRGEAVPAPVIKVAVEPDQDAVLLVEGSGGVFTWRFPEESAERGRRRRSGAEVLTFSLTSPAAVAARERRRRGMVTDWLVDKLIEPVRVRVLRFAASKAIDFTVDKIEGKEDPGLVVIAGDPESWTPGAAAPQLAGGRAPRVLLMVHGTFSTTAGSYGALAATEEGRAFLARAHERYDAIVGFDHRTLGADPDQNAQGLLAALDFIPDGATIDAVGFSRGGLVLRALSERFAPASGRDLRFGTQVFVGCTNGGTNLARPENWRALVDLYTNLFAATSRAAAFLTGFAVAPMVNVGIRTLGRFVQLLPELAIEEGRVPGLKAMNPDGDYVRDLNALARDPSRYFVVASDFEPRFEPSKGITGELAQFLIDRVADRLFTVANDLVVHTGSMAEFGDADIPADRILAIDPAESLYHTIYFGSPNVASALTGWLLDRAAEAEPVARMGDGDIDIPQSGPMRGFAIDREEEPVPRMAGGEPPARRMRGFGADREDLESARVPLDDDSRGSEGERESFSVPLDFESAEGGRDEPIVMNEPRARPSRTRRSRGTLESAPAPTATAAEEPAAAPQVGPCHFAAQMDPSPEIGQPVPLFVTISRDRIAAAVNVASKRTEAPVEVSLAEKIRIQVTPLENCRIYRPDAEAGGAAPDPVAVEEIDYPQRTIALPFYIEGFAPGLARIQVEALQGNRTLVSFLLEPVFVAASEGLHVSQTALPSLSAKPSPAVLRIYEMRQQDGTLLLRYDLACLDPNIGETCETHLPANFDMSAFVGEYLTQLENAYDLADKAYALFLKRITNFAIDTTNNLMPAQLREALWKHRGRIKAVQVISDSPHIPWELLYIDDPTGENPENAGFLCEWGLVRWMYNARWPDDEFDLSDVRFVVPDYLNRADRLEAADLEKKMLQDRFPNATPVEASSEAVEAFLQTGAADCDLLHFACHGEAKQKAVLTSDLILAGVAEKDGTVAEDVLAFNAVKRFARFSADEPSGLVFINACQTGRTGEGIAGVAGFADAFLRPVTRRGAAAFVGALWSVDDELALTFSSTFYDELLKGTCLVDAARKAREKSKANFDFTWLAYSVYGNPFATLRGAA